MTDAHTEGGYTPPESAPTSREARVPTEAFADLSRFDNPRNMDVMRQHSLFIREHLRRELATKKPLIGGTIPLSKVYLDRIRDNQLSKYFEVFSITDVDEQQDIRDDFDHVVWALTDEEWSGVISDEGEVVREGEFHRRMKAFEADDEVDDDPAPDPADTDPALHLLETMVLTDDERRELEELQENYVGLKMRGRRRVTRRGDKKMRQVQMLLESKKNEILKRIAADNMEAGETDMSPELKQALMEVSVAMLSDQTAKELEVYKQYVEGKGVRKRFLRWYSKKGLLAKIGIGVAGGAVISGVAALTAILTPFAVAGVGASAAVASGLRFARGYTLKDERHFKVDSKSLTDKNVLHEDIGAEYENQVNSISSSNVSDVLRGVLLAERDKERAQIERDRRRNRVGLLFAVGSVALGTTAGWALSQYMQGHSLTEIPKQAWDKLTGGGRVAELQAPRLGAIDTSHLHTPSATTTTETATQPETPIGQTTNGGAAEHIMNKTEQHQYIGQLREEDAFKQVGTLGKEVPAHGGVTETKVFYGDTPMERTEIALHKLGLKVEDRGQLREIMRAVKANDHIKFVAGPGADGVQPEVGIDVKTPSNAIAFKDAASARHFAELAMKHGAYNEEFMDSVSVKSGVVESFAGNSSLHAPEIPHLDSSAEVVVSNTSSSSAPIMDINHAMQMDGFTPSGGGSSVNVETLHVDQTTGGLNARESMVVNNVHAQSVKVNTAHGAENVVGKVLRANGINPTNKNIQATVAEIAKTDKSYFKDLGLERPFGGQELIGIEKRVRISQDDARQLVKAYFLAKR